MKRRKVKNLKKDRKHFAVTAARTKEINVKPLSMRGGTRL